MPDLRSQHGQATVDYVALIAALALLIGAAAALATGGAPGIANAVLGQLRRALCIVSGGACPAEQRRPCVVASRRDAEHVAVTIAIVRVDEDRYVLRERLSDGTVRLTLSERTGAGVEAGIGARARLQLRDRRIGFDREARGAGQGVLGHGEVHLARDEREADEIMRAIRRMQPPIGPSIGGRLLRLAGAGPSPREVFVEGGVRALGRLGLGGLAAGGALDGVADGVLGARRDVRTQDVTVSFGAGQAGWGLLTALLAGPVESTDGHVSLALTLDRDRRPIELSLAGSGLLSAGAALPPGLARALGGGDAPISTKGRRWELGARVDLRDPDVAAAWAAFRRDPTSAAAIRALGARLRGDAHLDARSYAVRSESEGGAAGLGLGLKLGGELYRMTDSARLLSAATRPPGGLWEQRVDCLAA